MVRAVPEMIKWGVGRQMIFFCVGGHIFSYFNWSVVGLLIKYLLWVVGSFYCFILCHVGVEFSEYFYCRSCRVGYKTSEGKLKTCFRNAAFEIGNRK